MRRARYVVFGGLFTTLLALGLAGNANALQVGDKAPDFTLAALGGKQVKLSDLTAKGPIVLYTFVQAFTGT